MDQSIEKLGTPFHFILGPSLDAVGGCERKAIRSELIRRRCLQKKLLHQQEQMVKLDRLLKGSLSSAENCKTFTHSDSPSNSDTTNEAPVPDLVGGLALPESKCTPSPSPELETPPLPETPSDFSMDCIRCGESVLHTNPQSLTPKSYCICDAVFTSTEATNNSSSYPIPTRWYMPMLLDHFSENIALASLPVDTNSLAYKLQQTWLNYALGDPCVFHATLYATSTHRDVMTGKSNTITLLHETETIRLINQRLDQTQAVFDDQILASIICLTATAPLSLNRQSSEAHMRALLSMIKTRGGLDALGLDGLLAGFAQLSSVGFAVIFDTELPIDFGSTSFSLPNCLLSTLIKQNGLISTDQHSSCPTTTVMFQDMYNAVALLMMVQGGSIKQETVEWIIHKGRLLADRKFCTAENNQDLILEARDHISRACHLATIIFWTILDERKSPHDPSLGLKDILLDLKLTIAAVDIHTWLTIAPALYTWVCLTGAAASQDIIQRAWFYFQQSHRALMSSEDGLLQSSWLYFSWLRGLRRGNQSIDDL